MAEASEVYVELLGEGVDVWRPIRAKNLGFGIYQIVEQPYDRSVEEWRFVPGDKVVCELVSASGGKILAAVRKV